MKKIWNRYFEQAIEDFNKSHNQDTRNTIIESVKRKLKKAGAYTSQDMKERLQSTMF